MMTGNLAKILVDDVVLSFDGASRAVFGNQIAIAAKPAEIPPRILIVVLAQKAVERRCRPGARLQPDTRLSVLKQALEARRLDRSPSVHEVRGDGRSWFRVMGESHLRQQLNVLRSAWSQWGTGKACYRRQPKHQENHSSHQHTTMVKHVGAGYRYDTSVLGAEC